MLCGVDGVAVAERASLAPSPGGSEAWLAAHQAKMLIFPQPRRA